jgi:predicted ATP-grasp superfamily ATP-dependent carboligase
MTAPHRKNVIYVTPDIERALGMIPQSHYRIATYRNAYSESIHALYPDFVTLFDMPHESADTATLIDTTELRSLALNLDAGIVVFKNNSLIESLAETHGLHLLNPHASLAEKVENKVSQVEWLGSLSTTYLPPHKIKSGAELIWNKTSYVFQWAHGHTGEMTYLIQSKLDADKIRQEFPERIGRVSEYIHGPVFTVNAVVTVDRTLMGNISYQITGVMPFTDNIFSTIGNDWGLTHSLLSDHEITRIEKMVGEIGARLREAGWKGLFGIDLVRDDMSDRIYLIEINARQPASTTFESQLQQEFRKHNVGGSTLFEAHDGAQIVQRVTQQVRSVTPEIIHKLTHAGYNVIQHNETTHNMPVIRIQSNQGIMETHTRFNSRGKNILSILTS